jgi:dTDP-4-dehydrorhamnose 3,5-epimerase
VIFSETEVDGAWIIDLEPRVDDRGLFARTFCADEFAAHGIDPVGVQCNLSWNHTAGTLRGMHYQDESAPEPKLVRCTRGAIWDVIVDMRPGSPTYLRSVGVELTSENRRALYIPAVCAHGYLTLSDDTEVTYQVGHTYAPHAERGLRHDDPVLRLEWPLPVTSISDKDAAWPLLGEQVAG